jgi:hypothetical protein
LALKVREQLVIEAGEEAKAGLIIGAQAEGLLGRMEWVSHTLGDFSELIVGAMD